MDRLAARRAAFSLIELLVVSAMIGVLVGLLLPSLNRAREKSREARCIANLRQIGQATFIYHSDFGVLPTASYPGYVMWNGVDYLLYGRLVATSQGKVLAKAFFCPSARFLTMNDPYTGIRNLGIPGKITAGTYYARGEDQGGPNLLDGQMKALLADLYDDTADTRNHLTGINVLYSDGSVRFFRLPWNWNITESNAWAQLDRGIVSVIP